MMFNEPQTKTQAVAWARSILKAGAVILDFETTDIKDAEIVQVGAVDTTGEIVLSTLVKPAKPISAGAMAVHGITPSMVQEAPRFEAVYTALSVALAGRVVVAYNAPFDRGVLTGVCERRRLPLPRVRLWVCAMRAYAPFYGQRGSRGYKWQSLSNACHQQKIKADGAHDATADCQMTLALIRAMAGENR